MSSYYTEQHHKLSGNAVKFCATYGGTKNQEVRL